MNASACMERKRDMIFRQSIWKKSDLRSLGVRWARRNVSETVLIESGRAQSSIVGHCVFVTSTLPLAGGPNGHETANVRSCAHWETNLLSICGNEHVFSAQE